MKPFLGRKFYAWIRSAKGQHRYGRDSIYPTIHFERCREGAEDFYLYQTLWNLAMEHQNSEGKKAMALLEDAVTRLKLNQRRPPEGFNADAIKMQVVEAIQTLR